MYNKKTQKEWTTARRISEQRREKGWTQATLADEISKVECSGKQLQARLISDWETGKNTPPMARIKIMAQLFGCDTAYLLGDGEDGQSLQSAVGITALTGLSDEAARKVVALKEAESIDVLSMLIEWDGFENLIQRVRNFTALQAVANLKENERALYEESELDSEKAVQFFAKRTPPVGIDAAAYTDQLIKAERLTDEEDFTLQECGDMLAYKTSEQFQHFLEHIVCQMDLYDWGR